MNGIDKTLLAERIRELEGLTEDERSALLGLLNERKKYGIVWEENPEEMEARLEDELPVLHEVAGRRLLSDDTDAPNHILIEGDNLHALTALSFTHKGKIDVIYIDPPYNTGNNDFVYNDKYINADDSYRHSKWLSFMHKRLRIAKTLLSDKGVIFISIDDNELAQLKLLCDEIFGHGNFVDIFSWVKTETPANLSKKTKKAVEYVICYTAREFTDKFRGLLKTSTSNNGLMNQTNSVHELVFPANKVDTKLKDGVYAAGMYGTASYSIELLNDVEVKDGYFITDVCLKGKFKWGQANLEREIARGTQVSIKTIAMSPSYEKKEYEPEVPWNIINRSFGVSTNEEASSSLKDILGNVAFDFPKPVSLIKYLISFTCSPSSLILDFFAGSGTTMHATMQLNAEDGGKRQCILVTNNENGICENITYERNKRVIQGYTKPNGDSVSGLTNNNLRYYKTDFVPREHTPANLRALVAASTDLLCIRNNIYNEALFCGKHLSPKVARFFDNGKQQMLIIYNEQAIQPIAEMLEHIEVQQPIKVYVFSPDEYPQTDLFEIVAAKVQLCAIPAAILNAYKRVMPKRKSKRFTLTVE